MNGERAHNHGNHRVQRYVPHMGHCSASMDIWRLHPPSILMHHLLYFQSLGGLLQISDHRQEKLILHGSCQRLLRWNQVQGLWVGAVCLPFWGDRRLYYHSLDKHGGNAEIELIPQERP
ncbi:hypothetical protein SLA2020_364630 [Shorea laevis]